MPSEARFTVPSDLLDRLPRTFIPLLNEQLSHWDQLFPAEQRPIRATLNYLAGLAEDEFQRLIEPIKQLEKKMQLPRWTPHSDRLSIEETSMLARSPFYPEWRAEVARFFEEVNASIGAAGDPAPGKHKLVVSVLPAGLPLESASLWPRLAAKGRWGQLTAPFGKSMDDFVAALAARTAPPGAELIEHTWVLESTARFARQTPRPALTVLSYEALAGVRNEFRRRLNEIEKDLRSADETYDSLRKLDMSRALGPSLGPDPRLREFVRNLFLSGNGAVLFNNSFVQWGASEALRRAQPQAMICCFGIRLKLKPFSSLVLFEDQNRANPVPDEEDPAGSLIDIQLLCDYIYLATERLPSYAGRTAHIFAACDSDTILLVAPPDFLPLPGPVEPLPLVRLQEAALDWLTEA